MQFIVLGSCFVRPELFVTPVPSVCFFFYLYKVSFNSFLFCCSCRFLCWLLIKVRLCGSGWQQCMRREHFTFYIFIIIINYMIIFVIIMCNEIHLLLKNCLVLALKLIELNWNMSYTVAISIWHCVTTTTDKQSQVCHLCSSSLASIHNKTFCLKTIVNI